MVYFLIPIAVLLLTVFYLLEPIKQTVKKPFQRAVALLSKTPWNALSTVQRKALYLQFQSNADMLDTFLDDDIPFEFRLEIVNLLLEQGAVPLLEVPSNIE